MAERVVLTRILYITVEYQLLSGGAGYEAGRRRHVLVFRQDCVVVITYCY